ncbi:hypothetical protein T492DRAFT_1152449 [Pavlovales sp. CCMP2436]|nr:hypothetical protein T492DRAFT_1152449 [Pavlovales sp. CCMP2436]
MPIPSGATILIRIHPPLTSPPLPLPPSHTQRNARPVRSDDPRLAESLRTLGLLTDCPDKIPDSTNLSDSPGGWLDPKAVRDAFLRTARVVHPDKLAPGASDELRREANIKFTAAKAAYESIAEAARTEAVAMPTFREIR